jgi:glutaredoxin-related protein
LLLIGSVILEDHMTGQNYLEFLQNELLEQLENVPLATRIAMYFQHDRAPSHYTRLSLIGGSEVVVPLTGHQDLQT